jgi:hypothetical protein
MTIPTSPDAITPDRLTAWLRQAGTIDDARVAGVRVEPVGIGVGFAGQSARLHLTYDPPGTPGPSTVFAKLSSAIPAAREQLRLLGLYRAETGFYRDLSAGSPIRTPRAYASLYDEPSGESCLILEDLAEFRFGDNIAGCSLAEAQLGMRTLARLHARYWEDAHLVTCPWLRTTADDATVERSYLGTLPIFEERWDGRVSSAAVDAARALGRCIRSWVASHGQGPLTLTHGDFRPDNYAFDAAGTLVLFDWQTVRRSPASADTAYFLSFSLEAHVRRVHERELLGLYHDALVEDGVRNYPLDQLMIDHRRSMGKALITMVIAGAMLDFSSERGLALIQGVCERVGAATEDWDFAGWAAAHAAS